MYKSISTKANFVIGTAAVALLAGMAAAPATAQDGAPPPPAQPRVSSSFAMEEIVVTAQRREESLQDVALAISAVSEGTLEAQNVQDVEDYFALVPNVSFKSNGSRDRKDLSIRGISNLLNPYADVRQGTYGFYIDEFNVAPGTSNPQLADLQRIEVLRGPQGTYFGRNSVGGAINIITNKPSQEFEGEVGLGYSSFDTWEGHAVLNVPVVQDVLAVRASGQFATSDGNITNINAIGGGNDSEYYNGRVQARLTPTDRLTWDFTYSYSDETNGMRAGVPTGFLTNTWRAVYYGASGQGPNDPIDITDPDGVGFYPENDDEVNFNRPQEVGSQYDFVSTRAQYDFDTFSVVGILGNITAEIFNYGDVDGGSPDFFYEDLLLQRESTSGELRVQSLGAQTFEWSVGVTAGKDEGSNDQSTFHGADSPLCDSCEGLEVTGADSESESKYWAVFGEATYHFSDQFAAMVGGRYSYEKLSNVSETRSNEQLTGTNDRSASFKDFSPKFTLTYTPQDDVLVYATVSRGFKSGGTQTSGSEQLRDEFDPEVLWNYELGTKFELFDKRLRFDITAFYMDWQDVQQTIRFQFIDPNTGLLRGVSGVANAASAESYGVELSFDARVTPQFMLSGQVGYNKATFTDYPNALIDGGEIDVSGEDLPNAPRWTASAQAQYYLPITAVYDGYVRAEYKFRDEVLSDDYAYRYNYYPFISPSYHTFNLRLGVESEAVRTEVYVENLFDEEYFPNVYQKAFYSGVQVEPSVRRWGVRASYKF
ncbi:TonB-dependent receptor [Pacificimonas sp. ICDLI1SI03]